MDNSVVIKGSKNGITVKLDDNLEFDELKDRIRTKFAASAKFFEKANLALSLEGRNLTDNEEQEILDIISEESDINIVCLMEHNKDKDEVYARAIAKVAGDGILPDVPYDNTNEEVMHSRVFSSASIDDVSTDNTLTQPLCQFYKGTLRSGQVLETESSVVILGDVNPGGKVIACGNVIVLGSLRGNIYAGANGNENAFVVALDMDPMQIKIADVIARSSDAPVVIKKRLKSKVKGVQPKIAYVFEGNIYVEDFAQDVLEDIHL